MDFGRILGGFWEDFWKDLSLQTMIRATKGKSMDGWMDGVDLIICLAIWTLYKRRVPLVSDDSQVISIASQNKLRSTSLCRAFFGDFGRVWGGFRKPKGKPKSIFSKSFFDVFFECVLASISGRFWDALNLKNH